MENRGSVVITGASTGIGAACALHLDKLGFQVFAGIRKPEDGDSLKTKASERLTPVQLDITQAETIAAAAESVNRASAPGLAGLVNNAGIVVAGMLEFLPLAALRTQLEVNVIGQVAVTQAFLPLLRKARGRVVNISSNSGFVSAPFLGPYCASKFAVEALTDALRMELRPWKIGVVAVEPGNIQTPIWEKSRVAAEELLSELPPHAHELYGRTIGAARQSAAKEAAAGIPAEAVARAVAHALMARRPKTRYRVGFDSKLQALLARFATDRLRDALITRYMKLP